MRNALPLSLALLLGACSLIPDYAPPKLDLPELWPSTEATEELAQTAISDEWWRAFGDETLNQLEAEGLAANDDLFRAASRVAEARALLSYREADQLPLLSTQGNATRTSNSGNSTIAGRQSTSKPFNSFGLAAVFDYEIDLWGRLRSATASARANLLATEAARDAVRLAVASDIATGYFNVQALNARIKITENTINARESAYRYQETQLRYGALDRLTASQAKSELEAARGELPLLQQARQDQESALAVLLGRSPKDIAEKPLARDADIGTLLTPPAVPADLPSTLLTRRPDIQAAEQRLLAANADIGVARTDYLPRISLGALLGLSSAEASTLLRASAREWELGANLSGPLIGFGRADAGVDISEAVRGQYEADYRQAIRQAFKETLDALSAVQTSEARLQAQIAEADSRAETLRLANLRYNAGYSTHLEVLDAERFLYQSQLERADAQRDRLVAVVNLYKSLGGGWANPK